MRVLQMFPWLICRTFLAHLLMSETYAGSDEEAAKVRKKLERKKVKVTPIEGHDGVDVGYIIEKKGKLQIRVTEEIFNNIVAADPSANKQYVEWMLIVFAKHIKDGDINQAVRFVTEDLPEEIKEFSMKLTPMGRFGTPQDIANAVVFLAAEESSFITGVTLQVDGGMVM